MSRSQRRKIGGERGMAVPAIVRPEVDGHGVVNVGCKLPNGLHLDRIGSPEEPIQRISLRGANSATVIGGFGITRNVPKTFFEEWMARNKSLQLVKNGLIFAHAEERSVVDYATERDSEVTGLEPLDQKDGGVEPLERE